MDEPQDYEAWDYEQTLRDGFDEWYDEFEKTHGREPTDSELDDYWGQV